MIYVYTPPPRDLLWAIISAVTVSIGDTNTGETMIGNTPSCEILSALARAVYDGVKALIDAGTAFTVTIGTSEHQV